MTIMFNVILIYKTAIAIGTTNFELPYQSVSIEVILPWCRPVSINTNLRATLYEVKKVKSKKHNWCFL